MGEVPARPRGNAVGRAAGDALVLFGEIGRSRAGLSVLAALFGGDAGATGPVPLARSLAESAPGLAKVLPLNLHRVVAGGAGAVADGLGRFPVAA